MDQPQCCKIHSGGLGGGQGNAGTRPERRPRAKTREGGTKPPHGHCGIGSKAINPFKFLVPANYLSDQDRLSQLRCTNTPTASGCLNWFNN
jgi:hypothetical protein